MPFIPTFKLYEADGSTLIYTFPIVQYTNVPQSLIKNTVIEGIRGQGCIIVPGSNGSWDLIIRFILKADDYEALTTAIDTLETTITLYTPFVLKIEKSLLYRWEYNVKRIQPIEYSESFRTNFQEVTITFKVHSW